MTAKVLSTGFLLNQPDGSHDDRFWALALVVTALSREVSSKPIAKT
jgi:hypothetical protein